jgi:hypothetical protein
MIETYIGVFKISVTTLCRLGSSPCAASSPLLTAAGGDSTDSGDPRQHGVVGTVHSQPPPPRHDLLHAAAGQALSSAQLAGKRLQAPRVQQLSHGWVLLLLHYKLHSTTSDTQSGAEGRLTGVMLCLACGVCHVDELATVLLCPVKVAQQRPACRPPSSTASSTTQ